MQKGKYLTQEPEVQDLFLFLEDTISQVYTYLIATRVQNFMNLRMAQKIRHTTEKNTENLPTTQRSLLPKQMIIQKK